MIVLIAMFVGIRDLAALLAIFAVNTAMILFGLLMERQQKPGATDWSAFWFGSLVGAVPWIAIVIYLLRRTRAPARLRLRDHHRRARSCSSASR